MKFSSGDLGSLDSISFFPADDPRQTILVSKPSILPPKGVGVVENTLNDPFSNTSWSSKIKSFREDRGEYAYIQGR